MVCKVSLAESPLAHQFSTGMSQSVLYLAKRTLNTIERHILRTTEPNYQNLF